MNFKTLIKHFEQAQELLSHFGFKTLTELQAWASNPDHKEYFTKQCEELTKMFKEQGKDIDLNIDPGSEPLEEEVYELAAEPEADIEKVKQKPDWRQEKQVPFDDSADDKKQIKDVGGKAKIN